MKLPPVPPIPPAHIPILLLLTVAAAVCLLLIAELRGRLMALPAKLPKTATPRQRLAASLGGLLIVALASVALFLIGGFVGLNYRAVLSDHGRGAGADDDLHRARQSAGRACVRAHDHSAIDLCAATAAVGGVPGAGGAL